MDKLKRYVVRAYDETYLTPRRKISGYDYRSGWSEDPEDAKIFQTRAAAVNSAKSAGEMVFEIVEVEVVIP